MARLLKKAIGVITGSALGGAAAAGAFGGPAEENIPPGPAERPTRLVLDGLAEIPGMGMVRLAETGGHNMIEFHAPDQDIKYPSAIAFDQDTGRIEEFIIRLGPLGTRGETPEDVQHQLEGEWADVVLDAASSAGIIDQIDGHNIDLGDGWVHPAMRPHVRLDRRAEPYDIPPRDALEFVEAVIDGFDRRFGTLQDRMADPNFPGEFDRRKL